jgi:hypothetical protein
MGRYATLVDRHGREGTMGKKKNGMKGKEGWMLNVARTMRERVRIARLPR